MASIRVACLALGLAAATACGGRTVEVRTAPTVTNELSVQVTNNLSQAVNIYATATGSTELFLRQVPANTVEKVPVQGVPHVARVHRPPGGRISATELQTHDVTVLGGRM